jgi:hypothetical protein
MVENLQPRSIIQGSINMKFTGSREEQEVEWLGSSNSIGILLRLF